MFFCASFYYKGCGSGLSGETISENGHHWIGLDISEAMLGKLCDNLFDVRRCVGTPSLFNNTQLDTFLWFDCSRCGIGT